MGETKGREGGHVGALGHLSVDVCGMSVSMMFVGMKEYKYMRLCLLCECADDVVFIFFLENKPNFIRQTVILFAFSVINLKLHDAAFP